MQSQSKTLVAMSMQLGVSVAVPTVLFAYIGTRLDAHYATGSMYLMIGLALGLLASLLLVWQIVRVALGKLGHPLPEIRKKK